MQNELRKTVTSVNVSDIIFHVEIEQLIQDELAKEGFKTDRESILRDSVMFINVDGTRTFLHKGINFIEFDKPFIIENDKHIFEIIQRYRTVGGQSND